MRGRAPEFHHRDFYYVPNSANLSLMSVFGDSAARNSFLASHDTNDTFGFSTMLLVEDATRNLVVWWSKTDRIPLDVLYSAFAGSAEEELRQCGQ